MGLLGATGHSPVQLHVASGVRLSHLKGSEEEPSLLHPPWPFLVPAAGYIRAAPAAPGDTVGSCTGTSKGSR